MITTLIDKLDTFQIVRDRIAQILANESLSQQNIASSEGIKDTTPWKFSVYTERSNPWEKFQKCNVVDKTPIVNVWFDNSTVDNAASNTVSRQAFEARFNIDVVAYSESTDGVAGDEQSVRNAHNTVKLVRNILMAGDYTYLGSDLRGLVWQRWTESITSYQPEQQNQAVEKIAGARFVLKVKFNEFSPQYEPAELQNIFVDVKRAEDGAVIAQAEYIYT